MGVSSLPRLTSVDISCVTAMPRLAALLDHFSVSLDGNKSFGATQFLRFVIRHATDNPTDSNRPMAIKRIAEHYTGDQDANLADVAELQRLLKRLDASASNVNDYQYLLSFNEKGIIRFGVASDLACGLLAAKDDKLIPHQVLSTHLDRFGLFSADSISELEDLINDQAAKELQFQRFFERYPTFLRRSDYREVHPHVYLCRSDSGPLIPDFILTNPDIQRSMIVELKRAHVFRKKLVRKQDNRHRFADAIMEARAQLQEYRDWFDQDRNRQSLRSQLNMEVYRPRMMVIIGRASDFIDGIERAKVQDRLADLEVLTYDDLVRFAKDRSFGPYGP